MAQNELTWGRTGKATHSHTLQVILIMTTTPAMVLYFFLCLHQYGGSLSQPIEDIYYGRESVAGVIQRLPGPSLLAWKIAVTWFTFQVILYNLPDIFHKVLPVYRGGIQWGAVSPAGIVLPYNINGLQAWFISNALFFLNGYYFRWFSPTIVFDNFGSILWVAIISGNILAVLAFIKAHIAPTHKNDCKFTGSILYDLMMGIEFNPRIGKLFDFKLFLNGRPGIVAWTVINMGYAWKQYELYGYVSNSMFLVNVLQAVYVVDYFWNEAWYLHTMDICHDHFGWYFAFGDLAWLPWMYTLQGHYLVCNPVALSGYSAFFVFLTGITGYYIFRAVNHQKDYFKKNNGYCEIWGRSAKFIPAEYETADGERRVSKLLVSGWWGVSRHMNYTADLIGSLSYSLCCGFGHLLPYFYFVYMVVLLVHRCLRDEDRCSTKYGKAWEKYTSVVPYRFIPYIF